MINRVKNFIFGFRDRQRINIALSKGCGMMQARSVDLSQPDTWEFSGFSQNGEDGIIDVLRGQLLEKNHYFIEIGAADGIENNTAWLLIAEKYNGIMIEGNHGLVEAIKRSVMCHSIGSQSINMFVTKENVKEIFSRSLHSNPDVFSLDIDGNDYYIAEKIFSVGFRPKIFVVEYNSVYGADRSLTIEYKEDFYFKREHSTELYYGVSITGWKNFFEKKGYRFVTVDMHGVNGFFVDAECFDASFINEIDGRPFAENLYQQMKFKMDSEKQFSLINDQKFIAI